MSAIKSIAKQLKFLKNLGGTTGARLMIDQDGKKYVVKAGKTPGHAENEYAADEAYRAMGIKVAPSAMVDGHLVREYVEGTRLAELTGEAREAAFAQLRAGFVADAYLGNWDVVGMGFDNVVVDAEGVAWRTDNGGALDYRAQGASKGSKWNGQANELDTMRGIGANNPSAAKVYGELTEEDLAKQFHHLEASGKLAAAQAAVGEAGKGNAAAQLSVRKVAMEKRFSQEGKAAKEAAKEATKEAAKEAESGSGSKSAPTTGKSFLGESHQEKLETLKALLNETEGASDTLLHQIAVINSGVSGQAGQAGRAV